MMKTRTRLPAPALALAVCAGLLAGPAFADQPGRDWMPADQVARTLEQAGYTDITALEADDGHWEGKALKDGRRVEFHADARTGAVTKEKVKDVKGKDGAGKDGAGKADRDDDDD